MLALVDTGSQISVVSEKKVGELRCLGIELPTLPLGKTFIIGADQRKSAPITRQVLMTLTIGNQKYDLVCLVVQRLIRPVIIGIDTLRRLQAVIDLKRGVVVFKFPGECVVVREFNKGEDNLVCGTIAKEEATIEEEIEGCVGREGLGGDERDKVTKVIRQFSTLFMPSLAPVRNVVFRIKLMDETPFQQKIYPIPQAYEAEVAAEIESMLQKGIIRKAPSPFLNPLVVVKKKGGKIRLCLDARKLNARTIAENDRPLPVDRIINKFGGAVWFSSTDFTSSYWQMRLHEDDQKYTAFLFKSRTYVFCRVPFGLKNSGAALTRCVEEVLGDDMASCVTTYVDDVVIFSRSLDDHVVHLREVFNRFEKANLRLNITKSSFLRKEIHFLGYVIDTKGTKANPDKVKAIVDCERPNNVRSLRAFLGMCNYYARFCKNYSDTISPMLVLLRKGISWRWSAELEEAFQATKSLLINSIMISHPDFSKRMFLETDSSDRGLGAVLSQRLEAGRIGVLSLISRTLKGPEIRYSTSEKEMLAIVWALQKLRTFLVGREFTIITDHKSLVFLSQCHLKNSRMLRWAVWLQEFTFDVQYREGSKNVVPDWLSRNPCGYDASDRPPQEGFIVANINLRIEETPWRGAEDVRRAQSADPEIGSVILYLGGRLPRNQPSFRNIKRSAARYKVHLGIVYIRVRAHPSLWRIWIPRDQTKQLITHIHTRYAHFGSHKVWLIARETFFWRGMRQQIHRVVSQCDLCQRTKYSNRGFAGPMQNIIPSKPREIYALDLYGPVPKTRWGNKFVLVIIDVFSKFVQVYPINKPTSKNCLAHLMNRFIPKCGVPEKVLSDHGSQFTSEEWVQTLSNSDIKVIYSSVRHPQSNPSERVMRELSRLFRVYCGDRHTAWLDVIPHINTWLNEVPHESIGMTPNEAHFGIRPRRSYVGIPDEVGDKLPSLERIHQIVSRNLRHFGSKRAKARKKVPHQFSLGEKVLLRTPKVSDPKLKLFHKFFPLYSGPYVIRRIVAPNAVELEGEDGGLIGPYNFGNLIPYMSEV